jgi:hypothetical protein
MLTWAFAAAAKTKIEKITATRAFTAFLMRPPSKLMPHSTTKLRRRCQLKSDERLPALDFHTGWQL